MLCLNIQSDLGPIPGAFKRKIVFPRWVECLININEVKFGNRAQDIQRFLFNCSINVYVKPMGASGRDCRTSYCPCHSCPFRSMCLKAVRLGVYELRICQCLLNKLTLRVTA